MHVRATTGSLYSRHGFTTAIPQDQVAVADRGPHSHDMEARLAVLEEIALSTRVVLKEIRDDVRDLGSELRSVRDRQDSDLRLVFGALVAVALGLASLMAKGFHWI